ncbi:MAG: VCBS repeat-containing protein [Candidatus Cloacimonadales bacterium]|nr:VCBS repeat-containing protein [Candidatus Cloacimonadales bacterium]
MAFDIPVEEISADKSLPDGWVVPLQNHLGIYHHDGTDFDNWTQIYPGPHNYITPVVGDIDNDGDLEIFGGGHTFDLMAKYHTGENVAGWPVSALSALECSPIVFDVDDDGIAEKLFLVKIGPVLMVSCMHLMVMVQRLKIGQLR